MPEQFVSVPNAVYSYQLSCKLLHRNDRENEFVEHRPVIHMNDFVFMLVDKRNQFIKTERVFTKTGQ